MATGRQSATDPGLPDSARALVTAAKELLAEQAPSAITGRELADRAGVNYGLVHRHFGSKAELLGRALDEMLVEFRDHEFDADGLPVPLRLAEHRLLWRSLAMVMLDRVGFNGYRNTTPVFEATLHGVAANRPDLSDDQVRAVAGLAMSIEVGVPLYRRAMTATGPLAGIDTAIGTLVPRWLDGLYRGRGPLGAPPDESRPSRAGAPAPPAVDGGTGSTVEERLVVAGAELLADRAPSAISGRQLARAAGVNYGLIHHYFGSKDEVLRQAVQLHLDRFFAERSTPEWSPRFFAVCDHPGYVRATTWSALDRSLSGPALRRPVTSQMVDRLVGRAGDPETELATRVAVFTAIAAQLMWALALPVLEQGMGTDPRRLEPMCEPLLRDLLVDPTRGTPTAH